MKRVIVLILILAILAAMPGCASWGRASFRAFDWAGATFSANPVSFVPYWIGFVLFAIAFAPLDLVSWPLTIVFFPTEEKEVSREFYWFSAIGPSIFGGVGGGTVLGGIFYPFGIPFMDERDDWNDEPAPPDDEPLPPPPGGSEPPPGEK